MNRDRPGDEKARCNRAHARRRAYERHGIDLSESEIARIEGLIGSASPSPDCVPVRADPDHRHRAIYAVRHADTWLPAVFDHATSSVISVLPSFVLDPYRAALEPVARPSPPPPPPPPRADAGPPVGTILGTVALSEIPPPAFTLGEIPSLGEIPTAAEIEAARDAVRRGREEIHARYADLKAYGPAATVRERARLGVELARLNDLGRELKHRQSAAYRATRARVAGVADPDDAAAILRALYEASRTMGCRLGWASVAPAEQAALNAAQDYLNRHGRADSVPRASDDDDIDIGERRIAG